MVHARAGVKFSLAFVWPPTDSKQWTVAWPEAEASLSVFCCALAETALCLVLLMVCSISDDYDFIKARLD